MNELIKSNSTTISSREIAEITGKEHMNIMRDIRVLAGQVGNQLKFALVDYKDAKGEMRPMYQLTKEESIFQEYILHIDWLKNII